MEKLCRQWLLNHGGPPKGVSGGALREFPERVIQFGEGVFLRAFADRMLDMMNEADLFHGRVVVVQPVREHQVEIFNQQDGLYTVLSRGIWNGAPVDSRRVVSVVSRALRARSDWAALGTAFCQPEIRFVISNTTEAGISCAPEPLRPGICPDSFPAKVTALLHQRFQALAGDPARGLVFLPCELIARNGDRLRDCVLQLADFWELGTSFRSWVTCHNHFLNTLVDQIVARLPTEEEHQPAAELGYEDSLMVVAEPYHQWVIEGPQALATELPLHRAGLNVIWTPDLTPYHTQKVRILNGAHTGCALAAFLGGLDTVRELVEDPVFGSFLSKLVFEEVLPTVSRPGPEKVRYAQAVMERLRNPCIRHELLSISLNSVSKWKVRILPSLLDFHRSQSFLPPAMSFSLAALICFYKGNRGGSSERAGLRHGTTYPIRDDPSVLDFFHGCWTRHPSPDQADNLAKLILGRTDIWGLDLAAVPGLVARTSLNLRRIQEQGMRSAAQELV